MGRVENLPKWVSVEQVAELEVFAGHVEALVPAEPLELGRVRA